MAGRVENAQDRFVIVSIFEHARKLVQLLIGYCEFPTGSPVLKGVTPASCAVITLLGTRTRRKEEK